MSKRAAAPRKMSTKRARAAAKTPEKDVWEWVDGFFHAISDELECDEPFTRQMRDTLAMVTGNFCVEYAQPHLAVPLGWLRSDELGEPTIVRGGAVETTDDGGRYECFSCQRADLARGKRVVPFAVSAADPDNVVAALCPAHAEHMNAASELIWQLGLVGAGDKEHEFARAQRRYRKALKSADELSVNN